jgi:hypothetical protein
MNTEKITLDSVALLKQAQQNRCALCAGSLSNGYCTDRMKTSVLVCCVCWRDRHPLVEAEYGRYRRKTSRFSG